MSTTKAKELPEYAQFHSTTSQESADRRRILFRARNRAMSILAQRHPEEFDELKNVLLVKWGHQPINPTFQSRAPIVNEDTSLNERAYE